MPDIVETPPTTPPISAAAPLSAAPPKTAAVRLLSWVREFCALGFWIYIICKVFVFEIDTLVLQTVAPQYVWLIQYRFFVFTGFIAIFLFLARKSWFSIVWFFGYVLFYPFIVVFWWIPYVVYKRRSAVLAFVVINSVVTLFKTIRYKIIVGALYLFGMFFIIVFADPVMLVGGMALLLAILVVTYARTFWFVFQPSRIYRLYSDFLRRSPTRVLDLFTQDKDIRSLPVESLNENQIQKRRSAIQSLVICNRALLFFSRTLREYQESKLSAMSYVFALLLLLASTVIAYAAVNYALFKLDPSQFAVQGEAGYFIFLYYSFHVFLFGGINEVTPVSFLSQSASMSEQLFAIVLLFIFASLFVAVQSERYKLQLDKTIRDAEETGHILETLIRSTYRLTLEEAMDEIRKLQNNLMGLILWLSNDLNEG